MLGEEAAGLVAITQPLRAAREHRYFPEISARLWSPRQAWQLGGGAAWGPALSLPFPRHAARPNRAGTHLSVNKRPEDDWVLPLRCPRVAGELEALVQNGWEAGRPGTAVNGRRPESPSNVTHT